MEAVTEKRRFKKYVEVTVAFDESGRMLPRAIKWDDELIYKIDRVLDIKQAASMRCGGQGDRYTIRVNGYDTYLFFERNASVTGNNIGRWFVEGKVAG